MEEAKIQRINELSKKAKQQELTAAEVLERAELRAEYINSVRENLKAQLQNIETEQ